jgi:pimeloyl-ACP methyl ester carboxylesterase
LLRTTPSARNDRTLGRLFFSARTGLDARIILSAEERSRIATPIDWLWGGRDAFAGPTIAREFVEPFPDARLTIVQDAGHAPWLDDLAATARFIGEALAADDQRAS